jgi:hypothetical protein
MEFKDAFGAILHENDIVVHAGGHGPYMEYTILRVVSFNEITGKIVCDKIRTTYTNPRNTRTNLLPNKVVLVADDLGALV